MKTIIANWKSNKNEHDVTTWLDIAIPKLKASPHEIVIAPPFPFLSLVKNYISQHGAKNIKLGVQDLSPYPAGSYTGAVGTKNLEGLSVLYAILGHSERRSHFHESEQEIANKVREAGISGITPILCVTRQNITSLANALGKIDPTQIIIAYEPVDHIGTTLTDSLENILGTKQLAKEAFGKTRYIYGGSVNPKSDQDILTHTEIDGFLIGMASLDPQEFTSIVNEF